jgi:hypothetical protein
MASSHLGEWPASQIIDIELEKSAVTRGLDGQFRSGLRHDRTVNIKWYLECKDLPFETPLSSTKTTGALLPIHVRSIDVAARHTPVHRTNPARPDADRPRLRPGDHWRNKLTRAMTVEEWDQFFYGASSAFQ